MRAHVLGDVPLAWIDDALIRRGAWHVLRAPTDRGSVYEIHFLGGACVSRRKNGLVHVWPWRSAEV